MLNFLSYCSKQFYVVQCNVIMFRRTIHLFNLVTLIFNCCILSNKFIVLHSVILFRQCRFWQDGSCLKGSECPFLHGYPVLPRRRNRSEGDSRESNRAGGPAIDGQQGSVLSQQLRREGGKQRHRLSSFELTSETDFPSLGAAPDTKVRPYIT